MPKKPPKALAKATPKTGKRIAYTDELGERICRVIATHTWSLQKMCDTYNFFPKSKETLYEWRYDYETFALNYARAKADQADLFIQEVLTISDDESGDILPDGRSNNARVQRARLMVDTRKWIACKVLPKVYGDRPSVEITNNVTPEVATQLADMALKLTAKHERDY